MKLKTVALAAALSLALGTAQAKDNLMLTYESSEDSIFGVAASAFVEEFDSASGGAMSVTVFPLATLAAQEQIPSMLQQGTCDLTLTVTSVMTDILTELSVLDLPYVFRDYQHARMALQGKLGEELASRLETRNLKVLGWMGLGFRQVSAVWPVRSASDFDGLKIRIQPNAVYRQIFTALNADPIEIKYADMYAALMQGIANAQENPYFNIAHNHIEMVHSHLAQTAHSFQAAAFVCSKITYDELTDEQKQWLQQAATHACETEWRVAEEYNQASKEELSRSGMQISEPDLTEIKAMTDPIVETYRSQYPDLLDLIEQVPQQ
ncbi:MAG: TRAP transporter substrate-binding protein [Succinivibrionaceae bacterium]|nr:TRAP transporter substrate-binding protein [Succinivibrionaceae bacterium]